MGGSRMPGKPRRLRRRLAITGLVVLLVLVLAYAFRGPLLGPLLADRIVAELEQRFGGRYEIDHVEGGLFRSLTVVGFRTVEPPPRGPLRSLAAERVELEVEFLGFLKSDVGSR